MEAMIERYKNFWLNGLTFDGRTSRQNFWLTVLCNVVVSFGVSILAGLLNSLTHSSIGIMLSGLYIFAVLVPGIALGVRRLHDIGRPGVHYLFGLIPLVGPIILIVFFAMADDKADNDYGTVNDRI